MRSFSAPFDVIVAGATGGIGQAFVGHLAAAPDVRHIWMLSRREPIDRPTNASWLPIDLENEATMADAADIISRDGHNVRLAIVAVGLLHDGEALQPEKTWRSMTAESLQRNFAINTVGPALLAKHLIPLLEREGKSVFAALSARVGSISDNRIGGWYGYRASKAALNMIIKSLAIEWARKSPDAVCIGLHPGTVATELSEPFRGGTPPEKLFDPVDAAERLLKVIDDCAAEDSGRCFAWDGKEVEP